MARSTRGRLGSAGLYSQLSELLAELPAIRIDVGDGVVAQKELKKSREPIQGTAVHFCKAVEVQVTGEEEKHVRVDVELWEM